jgi:hypothetical protein
MSIKKTLFHVIEFELNGMTCLRWFGPDGALNVWGPDEAGDVLHEYVNKCGPILQQESFNSFVASIPPFGSGDLIKKKHAMLLIFAEHEDDIKQGMGISADLVQTVLDTFEPVGFLG